MTLACPNAHYVCTPHTTKITQPPHHRHFIMVRYCEDSDDNFVSRTRQFNLYNTWQNSCDDNITFLSRIYHAHHAISTYRTICWDLARKGAELYTCCVQYEHNNFTPPTKQNGFIIPYDQSTLKDFCHYDINFMCKAKYEEFGEYVYSNLQHIYDAPVTQIVPFIARLYEKTAQRFLPLPLSSLPISKQTSSSKWIKAFDAVGLKLKGNILAVNRSSYHPEIIFTLHPS